MLSLQNILPPVSTQVWDKEFEEKRKRRDIISATRAAPPYGHRKGWIPRSQEDFGDGGSFPECHMAQYPLELGNDANKKSANNAIAVQLDETGKIKYDVLARQGHTKDKIIYSKITDLLPTAITSENDPELKKPTEEDIQDITEKTRQALEKLTQSKISSAMPVRCAEKRAPAQFLRYTPSQQGVAYNSGAQQRVIRMMEMPVDPMEPPKYKINKKVPRGPPSPPAPVMHSPTRKVTVKEQQEWRIPPCVSNWKNTKGYTIPLDKRLAADGRGLQSIHINEKFAKLAEALYIADRKAREQIEMRSQLEKKMVQKEKVRKEESLKMLAKKAREDQTMFKPSGSGGNIDEAEREKLRYDRARERKKDHAISNSKSSSKGKFTNRERDITEQIALGLPQKTTGGEAQFDQRLFNHSKGMDAGFGDEEGYNVYDRPWRDSGAINSNIYRPTRGESENYALDVDQLLHTDRFIPDKGFKGMDPTNKRSGPVQFQTSGSHEKEEEDLFGLIGLLSEAKNAGKRPADDRDDRIEKRRKRDRD